MFKYCILFILVASIYSYDVYSSNKSDFVASRLHLLHFNNEGNELKYLILREDEVREVIKFDKECFLKPEQLDYSCILQYFLSLYKDKCKAEEVITLRSYYKRLLLADLEVSNKNQLLKKLFF